MAFTYQNGRVPQDMLITFASGWLPNEGTWYHQLPPGTYAKHLTLVALAKRNTGRDLKATAGWSCYRPLAVQVYAKRVHGKWAADPGTSSHGMFWEKIQCAAVDYGNWSYVYNGDRAAFYRDVRAAGLEPGLISPARGYPDEPWHVVDKNPWAAGAATGGGAVPFAPAPTVPTVNTQFEEDHMSNATFAVRGFPTAKSTLVKTVDLATGEENEFESTNDATGDSYNRNVALTYGGSPLVPVSYISKSHYDKIGRENAERRTRLAEIR